jgi:hypothetical protein
MFPKYTMQSNLSIVFIQCNAQESDEYSVIERCRRVKRMPTNNQAETEVLPNLSLGPFKLMCSMLANGSKASLVHAPRRNVIDTKIRRKSADSVLKNQCYFLVT